MLRKTLIRDLNRRRSGLPLFSVSRFLTTDNVALPKASDHTKMVPPDAWEGRGSIDGPTPFYKNRFSEKTGWKEDKYKLVPFQKELLTDVLKEVPDVPYYYIGDPDPRDYPYKSVPMNEPIPITDPRDEISEKPSGEIHLARLENGLRIVSQDRGGYMSNIGLFVHVGARHETPEYFGCTRYLEHMAWHATAHLSWLRTIKTFETLAANVSCAAGKEHLLYQVEVERRFMPIVLPLVTGNVVFPRFLSWETNRKAQEFMYEVRPLYDHNLEANITDLLHAAAYKSNTLGHRVFPHLRDMKNFDPKKLRDFLMTHGSPDRMILVGLNVEAEDFQKWASRAFVDYATVPPSTMVEEPAKYTGGECRLDAAADPMSHLIIAFETPGGWNGEDLVATTVLQTILGGGGSFSTGGPGKGMFTRLYREVLCNHWVESCVAFNTQYTDSGLFGLYMIADAKYARRMLPLLREQILQLRKPVAAEELGRAKNSLKSSVHMNLENRSVVLEDMGRQLLMSGKILDGAELCKLIDNVTPKAILRAAERLLGTKPTLLVRGDIDELPTYQEVLDVVASA